MSAPQDRRRGPLDGVRVIDFTRVVAGPFCARMLADQGAEVIKIEPPDEDMTRGAPPFVDGVSAYFAQFNAGKLGVCVDLSDPAAAAAIAALVDRADVVIENFRPGVLDRFGLGAEASRARNPSLIYCSISGYGQHGIWRDRRCFAPVVHGEAGLLASSSRLAQTPTTPEPHSHADIQAGYTAMGAICAALFDRERTGQGTHLDVSLADSSLYSNEFTGPELSGQVGPAYYGGSSCIVLQLADTSEVATQGNPANSFRQWADAMGRPELLDDERFRRHEARLQHRPDIDAIIKQWAATVADFATFEAIVEPHRLAVGLVRSVVEVADTDWAKERRAVAEPIVGLRYARTPYRSTAYPDALDHSESGIGAQCGPPLLGEHTRSVLQDIAGLSSASVDDLFERFAAKDPSGGPKPDTV
jgi:CoA:oxalate CoA-transferase